ncbi:endonuclease/exonuclease/phosphatase family protein [Candidatus Kuenenbacteria bacterium]|nr:endonuclease/exonuclease/phosphatase family protein [Candidatus Kuenenbacteria bacterium]
MIEFFKTQNPDIITIQEILRHLDDSVFENYKFQEKIEKAIIKTYPYKFFGSLWVTDKFKKDGVVYREYGGQVEQGNEIMSKFPIVEATNEFYYKNFSYNLDVTNWHIEDHGRAVQVVELNVENKRLKILNVHGIWTRDKLGDKRTIAECKYIIEVAMRNSDVPTIIVGDFNLLPETKSISILNRQFKNLIEAYQIKSTRPNFEDDKDNGNEVVDYIFVNDRIKVNNFSAIDIDISDHLPLVLDFEII